MSDWTDHSCNRHFYPLARAICLDGSGSLRLMVPDLVSLDHIKEDTPGDGRFGEMWAAADYLRELYNVVPESSDSSFRESGYTGSSKSTVGRR